MYALDELVGEHILDDDVLGLYGRELRERSQDGATSSAGGRLAERGGGEAMASTDLEQDHVWTNNRCTGQHRVAS